MITQKYKTYFTFLLLFFFTTYPCYSYCLSSLQFPFDDKELQDKKLKKFKKFKKKKKKWPKIFALSQNISLQPKSNGLKRHSDQTNNTGNSSQTSKKISKSEPIYNRRYPLIANFPKLHKSNRNTQYRFGSLSELNVKMKPELFKKILEKNRKK